MIYVALLRGINVGGHTAVNMTVLKTCFTHLGYQHVTTYINSGNVIFTSQQTDQRKLEAEIEKVLHQTFSFPIRVVVRNFEEMQKIINSIPEKWGSQTEWRHNVIFLTDTIDKKGIFKNVDLKSDTEEAKYFPGAVLWSTKTSDLSKSAMLQVNKSALLKEMTVRNLNTTRKIYELMKTLHQSS